MNTETELLEVIRLGHPVLRMRSEPLPEADFGSTRLEKLRRDMLHTMAEEGGVGLAAPQVAESLRLFVYWLPGQEEHAEIPPRMLINPEIRPIGTDIEEGWEGCLSIPGLRGMVPRHERIKVKARDFDGRAISFTADGFHARVIQHEFDHLNGVVFLDRMTSMDSLCFEKEWETYILRSDEEDDEA